MTYTEEQLKKIAEWMELNISKTTEYNKNKPLVWSYGREFEDWLHSPEGQAAVMDVVIKSKLQPRFCIGDIPSTNIKGVKCGLLSFDTGEFIDGEFCLNWQEALIAAVLKMLEAK